MEKWILVKNLDGEQIKVRQHVKYGDIFVDENGKEYKASHLDFTKAIFAFPKIKNSHFDELKEMMKSWDVKEQDNNRALIAEREYWRKLRGDIFLELLRKSGMEHLDIKPLADDTDIAFNAIYEQDSKFFADKMVFNVPVV
jgi:hypothetical protein